MRHCAFINSALRHIFTLCFGLTLAALAEPVGGRLAAVGVVALGLFLLAVVGEGRLAELASPLVERVDGRDLAEFGLDEPTSG